MKKLVSAAATGVLIAALAGCSHSSDQDSNASSNAAPKTTDQKVGYSIGMSVAQNLKQIDPSLDLNSFKQAMDDVYADRDTKLTQDQAQQVLSQFQKQQIQKQRQKQEQSSQDNQKAGAAFLADNAKKDGVKKTADGLQYKVIKSGDSKGAKPTGDDTVRVNYEGRLINGTVFDSSYKRGQPVTFKVNEVIPGWQEALKMMRPGDQWEIYIPANLAYGPAGVGPIGPNETLIFKVDLMAVNPTDSNDQKSTDQQDNDSQ